MSGIDDYRKAHDLADEPAQKFIEIFHVKKRNHNFVCLA